MCHTNATATLDRYGRTTLPTSTVSASKLTRTEKRNPTAPSGRVTAPGIRDRDSAIDGANRRIVTGVGKSSPGSARRAVQRSRRRCQSGVEREPQTLTGQEEQGAGRAVGCAAPRPAVHQESGRTLVVLDIIVQLVLEHRLPHGVPSIRRGGRSPFINDDSTLEFGRRGDRPRQTGMRVDLGHAVIRTDLEHVAAGRCALVVQIVGFACLRRNRCVRRLVRHASHLSGIPRSKCSVRPPHTLVTVLTAPLLVAPPASAVKGTIIRG